MAKRRAASRVDSRLRPRVEDYIEEGQYVLRAGAPGIDPDMTSRSQSTNGVLTIKAELREQRIAIAKK